MDKNLTLIRGLLDMYSDRLIEQRYLGPETFLLFSKHSPFIVYIFERTILHNEEGSPNHRFLPTLTASKNIIHAINLVLTCEIR